MLRELLHPREREEKAFVRRFLPRDRDVIDLGAGMGLVAREVLKRLAPGTQYLGVEMNRELLGDLDQVLRSCTPGGVRSGFLWRAICQSHPTVGVWQSGDWSANAAMQGTEVRTDTLSGIVQSMHVRDGFSLLVDIEGMESDVIRDPAIRRAGTVVMEFHDVSAPTFTNPHPMSPAEGRRAMEALGFRELARGSEVSVFAA